MGQAHFAAVRQHHLQRQVKAQWMSSSVHQSALALVDHSMPQVGHMILRPGLVGSTVVWELGELDAGDDGTSLLPSTKEVCLLLGAASWGGLVACSRCQDPKKAARRDGQRLSLNHPGAWGVAVLFSCPLSGGSFAVPPFP